MTPMQRLEVLKQARSLLRGVYHDVQFSCPLELALDDTLLALNGAMHEAERTLKRLTEAGLEIDNG